jgi:5'-nucleotidase/UDP-sugar diphosphatase
MKKILIFSLILLPIFLLQAEQLTLFFTNDTHGAYQPNTYNTKDGKIELGGYENLYNIIQSQRDTISNSLWLDAGDQQTGSVFSALVYKNTIGGAVVTAFSKMGLDAATLGNHEFDQSLNNTKRLAKLAEYPFLSANIINRKSDKPFNGKPYKVFRKGGLRIGVLGLTLTDLAEKVKAENVSTLNVLPYKQTIDKYLPELDRKTDLIILLTHIGIESDSLLATQLDNRVDLIVGGHTHAVLETPMLVNGIYIVQAGAQLAYYGKLDLEILNDRISNLNQDMQCLFLTEQTRNSQPSEFIDFFTETTRLIDENMNRVIGYTEVDWIPDKYKEAAVSQWQADALYKDYFDKYKPDMAMLNCGGIRKAIPAGEIRLRDMMEMLPFTNYITVFSCYGRDLPKFIEHNLALMETKEHDIVQTHNLKWQTKDGLSDNKVWDVRVKDEPVVPDKVYRIVSHDYLAGQADKYLLFEPFDIEYTDNLILDVMVRQVEKQLGKKKL